MNLMILNKIKVHVKCALLWNYNNILNISFLVQNNKIKIYFIRYNKKRIKYLLHFINFSLYLIDIS